MTLTYVALERLRAAKPKSISIHGIRVDDNLQSRSDPSIPFREQTGYQRESNAHIQRMRDALLSSVDLELEPVLLAVIDGKPHVIDGFHRIKAYKAAGRKFIVARKAPMSRDEACIASKMVNIGAGQFRPHQRQLIEQAWQFFVACTLKGRRPIAEWPPVRRVGATFGVSPGTIQNMRTRLEKGVDWNSFGPAALDLATGIPRWKYVTQPKGGFGMPDVPFEVLAERRVAKAVVKIGAVLATLQDQAELRALCERIRSELLDDRAELATALEDGEGLMDSDF